MLKSGHWQTWLRNRLEGRDTLRRAFGNSFWLFSDQIVRMAAGLLVGVWVARYLGPENFGWLNYAMVTVGLIAALATPAISVIVVRELARVPEESGAWMGAAFFVRAVGAAMGFLACVGVAWQHSGGETPAAELILIVGAGVLLQTADVADLWFQGRGEARVAAGVRIAVCVFGSALRVALILGKAPLVAFAAAGVAELAVAAAGWWWVVRQHGSGSTKWSCRRASVVGLLRASWPLTVSAWAIVAQAYADQLVIGLFLGAEELGQYAAALRLVSAFAFVPMVIHTVSAPEIARAKRDDENLYRRRLHSLYRVMFGTFLAVALPLILLGPWVALRLYGPSYAGAAALIPWLALRLFFTSFGVARGIFLTNDGLLRFGLATSIAGAITSVALNLAWVPRWGVGGAIAAAMASFFVTTFAFEAWEPRARGNLKLMARAVFTPWRPFGA